MRPLRTRAPRAGFSLVETLVAVAVFSILMGGLTAAILSLGRSDRATEALTTLQAESTRALTEIREDLARSGVVSANGVDYPYLFDDGAADEPFEPHSHDASQKKAGPNDSDFGPNREIVFALPADADMNGVPDVDVDGTLMWDNRDYSFVVVTGQDGETVLERRVNTLGAEVVARHVERVTFDDAFSAVGEVPLNAIRVRIWFRKRGGGGLTTKYFVETTIRMRNGG